MGFLSIIPIIMITFLPILIWGYIFSYLDNSPLGGRRFGLGIVAGAISVVPVLFMNDLLSFFGLADRNIFPLLVGNDTSTLAISLLIGIGLISISVFIASIGIFTGNIGRSMGTYLRNTIIILFVGILFSLFHLVFFPINLLESPLASGGVTIGGTVFGTMKLVLFYYVIIGLVEEASKHFCVITSSLPSLDSVRKGVLFSVFIALGFGFIENILYLKNIADQSGVLSSWVLTTWIFRSIFSLMTHIACSVIVGLHFSRAFLDYGTVGKILPYTKTVLYGFILSIIVHAVFDISLTVWFTGIIFIYFFGSYLSITRIFYEEES